MLDEGKIAAAVPATMRFIGNGNDRLARLADYLAMLKADPSWTPDEIAAVETLVRRLIRNQT